MSRTALLIAFVLGFLVSKILFVMVVPLMWTVAILVLIGIVIWRLTKG